MRFFIGLFVLLTISISVTGQMYIDWGYGYGGINEQSALDIVFTPERDIVSAGYYAASISFSQSSAYTRVAEGVDDGYVMRQNSSGGTQWVKSLRGSGSAIARSLAIDDFGNIYCTGDFTDTLIVETDTLISRGNKDVFLIKLNPEGDLLWSRQYGGPTIDDGVDVKLDSQGNPHMGCQYRIYGVIEDGLVTDTMYTIGTQDIGLISYDTAGNFLRSSTYGSAGPNDKLNAIDIDEQDNIYLFGNFRDQVDFNNGPGEAIETAYGTDVLLVKVDSLHTFQWVQVLGGATEDVASEFHIANDAIYMTGLFKGDLDGQYLGGDSVILSVGLYDAFVVKISLNGAFEWARSLGDYTLDSGLDIKADAQGNVYATGFFVGTVDLDPGPGVQMATSNPSTRTMYLQKFDGDGHLLYASAFAGQTDAYMEALDVDDYGRIVVAGRYKGTTDIAPGPAQQFVTSDLGASDMFVAYYTQCRDSTYNVSISACESYLFGDSTLSTSGVYTQSYLSALGCDSIVELTLELSEPLLESIELVGCDSIEINDSYVYSTGLYEESYPRPGQCDSIVAYQVTMNFSTETIDDTLSCGPAVIEGVLYTESTQFDEVLSTSAGCDSLIHREITIYYVDTVITSMGSDLTAPLAMTYQWVDCTTDEPIIGATAQLYSAPSNGTYAVVLDDGTCSDTTACISVIVDGLTEQSTIEGYLSYDPSTQVISTTEYAQYMHLDIIDARGRLHVSEHVMGETSVSLQELRAGLYFIRLVVNDHWFSMPIVLE